MPRRPRVARLTATSDASHVHDVKIGISFICKVKSVMDDVAQAAQTIGKFLQTFTLERRAAAALSREAARRQAANGSSADAESSPTEAAGTMVRAPFTSSSRAPTLRC